MYRTPYFHPKVGRSFIFYTAPYFYPAEVLHLGGNKTTLLSATCNTFTGVCNEEGNRGIKKEIDKFLFICNLNFYHKVINEQLD